MNINQKYKDVDSNPGFTIENEAPSIIKVVGVGGGGNNAINHMYSQNVQGVTFVVCNTDRQALQNSPVPNRLLLGPQTTKGLGAGNVPEVAREAAEESCEEIAALFDEETKMVFITAGMGGGTGTGAAPVVARIAREKHKLTIGIVTIPFLFEGKKKIIKALEGADKLSEYVDAILIINNQRLTEIYPDLDLSNAFALADDTLTTAARSISDIISASGHINLDFNDVNTTLRDGGVAIISTGSGEGENRVTKAIQNALNSPLLKNRDVFGSKKILLNFYYNPKAENPMKAREIDEMNAFMSDFYDDELDVITGMAYDYSLGDDIKVTILASGFNVSLEKEGESVIKAHKNQPEKTGGNDDQKTRLAKEYGPETINKAELNQAKARYIVLEPEDYDNDALLELFEKNPTLGRSNEVRQKVKEMQMNKDKSIEDAQNNDKMGANAAKTILFG